MQSKTNINPIHLGTDESIPRFIRFNGFVYDRRPERPPYESKHWRKPLYCTLPYEYERMPILRQNLILPWKLPLFAKPIIGTASKRVTTYKNLGEIRFPPPPKPPVKNLVVPKIPMKKPKMSIRKVKKTGVKRRVCRPKARLKRMREVRTYHSDDEYDDYQERSPEKVIFEYF